jgi:cold shock CspA family protein
MAGCTAARVSAFDAGRGAGSVVTDDGRELSFHATRVADGSRSVDVGARVVIEIGPGVAPGSWEATTVLKTVR